jgi:tetratricopeptide (TPR) repeat protein
MVACLICSQDLTTRDLTQGRYGEAEPLLKQTVTRREKALGAESPATLVSVNNLAVLYDEQGRYAEAEPLYKRALTGREKALGPEHPNTLASVNDLGALYWAIGRYGEAESLLKRAQLGQEKALGPEHPVTLTSIISAFSIARNAVTVRRSHFSNWRWRDARKYRDPSILTRFRPPAISPISMTAGTFR